MDSDLWVGVGILGAAAVWWLVRGDVGDWRLGLRDPGLSGALILSLAVGLLAWVWLASVADAPAFVFIVGMLSALTAAWVVVYALRLLIVVLVRRMR